MKICKVKGCDNEYLAKGYCSKHYQQLYLYGKILDRTIFDKNKIVKCDNYCEMSIYKNNKEIVITKIDWIDLVKVKQYKWHLDSTGYVRAKILGVALGLHTFLMKPAKGLIVDHKDHNILNNRKNNLRIVTYSQNNMNRIDVKGYSWNIGYKRWEAYIQINKKKICLGYFKLKKNAIIARYKGEQKYFGEFANSWIGGGAK